MNDQFTKAFKAKREIRETNGQSCKHCFIGIKQMQALHDELSGSTSDEPIHFINFNFLGSYLIPVLREDYLEFK